MEKSGWLLHFCRLLDAAGHWHWMKVNSSVNVNMQVDCYYVFPLLHGKKQPSTHRLIAILFFPLVDQNWIIKCRKNEKAINTQLPQHCMATSMPLTHRLIVILAFPCLVKKESTCSHPALQLWHWCANVDCFTQGKKWNSKRNTCGQSARKKSAATQHLFWCAVNIDCFNVDRFTWQKQKRNQSAATQCWLQHAIKVDCVTQGKNEEKRNIASPGAKMK